SRWCPLRARPTGRRCGIRDSCGAGDERQKSRMRLSEIAQRLDLELDGRHGDEAIEIRALAPIEDAVEGDLTFVAAARYRPLLASTRASAVILAAGEDSCGRPALRARDPYSAFARALALFDHRLRPQPGIHPTSVISATA